MAPPRLTAPREPHFTRDKDWGGGSLAVPTPGLFWALGGFPSSTGVPVSPLTAIQSSTVYGCAKARSEDLAKVPLRLKRIAADGGSKILRDHPIARLLKRPNEWMTPFTFKRYLELSVCYRGNAYVVIRRNAAGDPFDLIPISPDNCSPEISAKGNLFYRIRHPLLASGGQQIKLHSDNVLHIKNIGLDVSYMGISPIAAAQEVIGLALAAQQHGAILFRQGAQFSGAIKHPMHLNPEGKDYLERKLAEKYQGVQNAHKVLILDEGMTFEKLGMTNEDAQFLELRQFQRSEICAIFRVPPHKVMDLGRATYTNMEVGEQAYINDALMPDAEQIAEEMSAKLLFDDERDEMEFSWDWDAMLRADRKTRYEAHAIGMYNGFLSQNDVMRMEGRPTIPNGDVYERPLNIGAAGVPGPNTPKPAGPNAAKPPTAEATQPGDETEPTP